MHASIFIYISNHISKLSLHYYCYPSASFKIITMHICKLKIFAIMLHMYACFYRFAPAFFIHVFHLCVYLKFAIHITDCRWICSCLLIIILTLVFFKFHIHLQSSSTFASTSTSPFIACSYMQFQIYN